MGAEPYASRALVQETPPCAASTTGLFRAKVFNVTASGRVAGQAVVRPCIAPALHRILRNPPIFVLAGARGSVAEKSQSLPV